MIPRVLLALAALFFGLNSLAGANVAVGEFDSQTTSCFGITFLGTNKVNPVESTKFFLTLSDSGVRQRLSTLIRHQSLIGDAWIYAMRDGKTYHLKHVRLVGTRILDGDVNVSMLVAHVSVTSNRQSALGCPRY